jgi:uncharacterized surface protein with fasciclin (FAS1) repeats
MRSKALGSGTTEGVAANPDTGRKGRGTVMRYVSAFTLVGVLAVAAQAQERPTIYSGLLAGGDQSDLSTFVQSMNDVFSQEDRLRVFDGEYSFTIFAPSDVAFGAHPEGCARLPGNGLCGWERSRGTCWRA